jgi:hypothetical protein
MTYRLIFTLLIKAMTIKVTKKQLNEMITAAVTNYMADMGDTKMSPEAHLFYFRGTPPQTILSAVSEIVTSLEDGGIKLQDDKDSLVNKIVQEIHKIIKQGVENVP